MKKIIKKFFSIISEVLGIAEIRRMQAMDRRLSISRYMNDYLYHNKKYSESNRLNKFEFSVYSQGGDDGIIHEIFRRIGTTNKFFVEFGVGDGLQNNTAALLLDNWKGVWIEADPGNCKKIEKNLNLALSKKQLTLLNDFAKKDNINNLFSLNSVSREFDILSIDIDGNDYHIWQALNDFKPRVVVIEYNAFYGTYLSLAQKYDKNYFWGRTHFYGSSLSALNKLAKQKGYLLVACNFFGNNAFFVRDDLIKNTFDRNLTVEDLFEEHKPFLLQESKYRKIFIENDII